MATSATMTKFDDRSDARETVQDLDEKALRTQLEDHRGVAKVVDPHDPPV